MMRSLALGLVLFAFACEGAPSPLPGQPSAVAAQPLPPATPIPSPLENLVAEGWDRGNGEHFVRLTLAFRNTDSRPHAVNVTTLRGVSGPTFLTVNEAGSPFANATIPSRASVMGRVYLYDLARAFPQPTTITVTYQDGTYGPFNADVPVTIIPTTGLELVFYAASVQLTREFVQRPSPMHSGETWIFRVTVGVRNPSTERRKFLRAFRVSGETEDIGSLDRPRAVRNDPDDVLAPGERIDETLVFGLRGALPRPTSVTVMYAPNPTAPELTRTFTLPP